MTVSGPRTKILALHGFLGLPRDWDQVHLGFPIEAVDLWRDVFAVESIEDWATRFNAQVRAMGGEKPVLLGYSMGGRLAMQAVLQAPELYCGAIFVSAHPGLTHDADRAARVASDRIWAARFRNEPWSELMTAWQDQGVLKRAAKAQEVKLERVEPEFDREKLARALEIWTLGRQPAFAHQLALSRVPALFVSGTEDEKFTRLLSGLKLGPAQSLRVIENAGHRVPWEQPRAFADAASAALREFLATPRDLC